MLLSLRFLRFVLSPHEGQRSEDVVMMLPIQIKAAFPALTRWGRGGAGRGAAASWRTPPLSSLTVLLWQSRQKHEGLALSHRPRGRWCARAAGGQVYLPTARCPSCSSWLLRCSAAAASSLRTQRRSPRAAAAAERRAHPTDPQQQTDT